MKRVKMFRLLSCVSFCALFLLIALGQAHADIQIGQPAPALIATLLDGKKVDLSTLKGKVVIVHFWATWCAPCRDEMPALEAIWRQYHGKGMEVIAISGDRPRARGDVEMVMHYFTFPAGMFSQLDKNDFGTPSIIPVTYVIDKQGVVQDMITPDTQPLNEQWLGDRVKTLLDAKVDGAIDKKADEKNSEDKKSDDKTEDKK